MDHGCRCWSGELSVRAFMTVNEDESETHLKGMKVVTSAHGTLT